MKKSNAGTGTQGVDEIPILRDITTALSNLTWSNLLWAGAWTRWALEVTFSEAKEFLEMIFYTHTNIDKYKHKKSASETHSCVCILFCTCVCALLNMDAHSQITCCIDDGGTWVWEGILKKVSMRSNIAGLFLTLNAVSVLPIFLLNSDILSCSDFSYIKNSVTNES